MATIIKEVKRVRLQTLARVLSGKKLTLIFGAESATDLKTITLTYLTTEVESGVPATEAECWLAQKALCAHESGHILFTSRGVWESARAEGSPLLTFLLNVIEDARIERCMANTYEGTLPWFRFLNDYVFKNRKEWGEGPRALVNGLLTYAVVGRIPAPIEEQEKVMDLIRACASFIDEGRIAPDTEGAYSMALKVWETIKSFMESFTPPPTEAKGTKKPKRAPKGTMDPRREPKLPEKPKEPGEPGETPGEESSPDTSGDGTDTGEEETSAGEPLEESRVGDEEPDKEEPSKETAGDPESTGPAEEETPSEDLPKEDTPADKSEEDPFDDDPGEDTDEDLHDSPGHETSEEPFDEDDEDGPGEEFDDLPEEDFEFPEDDPLDHEDAPDEFPDGPPPEEFGEEPGDDDPEESGDDTPDGSEVPAGPGGSSGDFWDPGDAVAPSGESPEPEVDIDLSEYGELLDDTAKELETIKEADAREEKLAPPKSPDITEAEITAKLGTDINHRVVFKLRDLPVNRALYERLYRGLKPFISKATEDIRRALEYKASLTERNLRKGRLDAGALWKISVSDNRLFCKTNQPDDTPTLAIYLLVDCSGSMSGTNMENARDAALLLYEVCAALKIPVNVTGFTGELTSPNNDVTHLRAVNFDSPQETKYAVASLTAMAQNRDGYSIRVATRELALRPEKHKVLMVLSDGLPCMPYGGYSGKPGVIDTAKAVREAEKQNMGVIGLFFGHESYVDQAQRIYTNLIFVREVSVLPRLVARTLKKIITGI